MSKQSIDRVRSLLARYSDGDLGAVDELVAIEFFSYAPTDDEPTATEVYRGFAAELKAAAPDLRLDIPDLAVGDGEVLAGEAVVSGTWAGELWGAPPSGETYTFRLPVRVRPVGDRFAFALDLETPGALAILRELGLVNPPDQMHLPPPHPVVLDDFLVKVLFTGQVADKPCAHLADIKVTRTEATTCDDCAPDEIWPALRMCLTCGHVGCCDTSTHKHAKAHWEQTGHPLMRSIRMDEGWAWCYEDNAVFQKRTLEQIAAGLGQGA
jgi:predicted ester cyclase